MPDAEAGPVVFELERGDADRAAVDRAAGNGRPPSNGAVVGAGDGVVVVDGPEGERWTETGVWAAVPATGSALTEVCDELPGPVLGFGRTGSLDLDDVLVARCTG